MKTAFAFGAFLCATCHARRSSLLEDDTQTMAYPKIVPDVKRTTVHSNFGGAVFKMPEEKSAHFRRRLADEANRRLESKEYIEATGLLDQYAIGDFEVTDVISDSHNGVTHVHIRQLVMGIPVINGLASFSFDEDFNVVSFSSSFFRGKESDVNPNEPMIAERAMSAVHRNFEALGFSTRNMMNNPLEDGMNEMRMINGDGTLCDIFVMDMLMSADENPDVTTGYDAMLNVAVNSHTGEILQIVDYVDEGTSVVADDGALDKAFGAGAANGPFRRKLQGNYRGYAIPDITPTLGNSVLHENPEAYAMDSIGTEFEIAGAAGLDPASWQSDGVTSFSDTRGNYAFAQENQANSGASPPNGYRPSTQVDGAHVFDFAYDHTQDPTSQENLDALITNLFYLTNICHDVLYTYGFDEQSGNFQTNNFGRGGAGNDAVVSNALDGSGTNNANFATPPDGTNGRMRMYRWTYTSTHRSSSLDGLVIAHEYGHGLSNRLTGGPSNSGCLATLAGGGMGEGWSDFMGVFMSIGDADGYLQSSIPVGDYLLGAGLNGAAPFNGGIRMYPYEFCEDLNVACGNPHVFSNVNSASGVHAIGNIFGSILFDMAANLVQAHGYGNVYQYANKDLQGGNQIAFQNIIDGMKLQPCLPDFITARNAMLLADQMNYGSTNADGDVVRSSNYCLMWESFARRGLGCGSGYDGSVAVDGFDLPIECGGTASEDECSGENIMQTPTPAPVPDSCLNHCGGGPSGCFCDDQCQGYGDCCDDYEEICLEQPEEPEEPEEPNPPTEEPTAFVAMNDYIPPCSVEVMLDNYPDETSYSLCLSNEPDNCVLERSSPHSTNLLLDDPVMLDFDTEYTFTILDSYGDGICCSYGEGYYRIICNGDELVASGGSFESEEIRTFTTAAGDESPNSSSPTFAPTSSPTFAPTSSPTSAPTFAPTSSPTSAPTFAPTSSPTFAPTYVPTGSPTYVPTDSPTSTPTAWPTPVPTASPTDVQTASPTDVPTAPPTDVHVPTAPPTDVPTATEYDIRSCAFHECGSPLPTLGWCYCNSECTFFFDCCWDYPIVCPAEPTPAPTPQEATGSPDENLGVLKLNDLLRKFGTTAGNPARYRYSGDVFYQFTISTDVSVGTLRISLCGAPFDTYLILLDSYGIEIASNDDSAQCGLQSILEVDVATEGPGYIQSLQATIAPGMEYTVVVSGYGQSSEGDFEMEVMLEQNLGPSCAGICGNYNSAGCWCDSLCSYYGDCCSDKIAVCGTGFAAGQGFDLPYSFDQNFESNTGSFNVNGEPCLEAVVVSRDCNTRAPDFDYEGAVCANDGQSDEAYCSFEVGEFACAYCVQSCVPCEGRKLRNGRQLQFGGLPCC